MKCFSGSSYQGYPSIETAISAWEHAVSSGVVGPCPANSRCYVSPPTTPSRSSARNRAPSTPSSAHKVTDSSSPSHGSATRLASITSALEELGLESREPFYVLRGLSPGVYANRRVSACLICIFINY